MKTQNLNAVNNEILSENDVVKLLGVQPRALRRWRQELGLPYIKISSRVVRYRRCDIDEWVAKFRRAVRS